MNLDLYEKLRSVPSEAQKPITAGRLKGMTDINPMWRIKALTEQFGVCGIGWYTKVLEMRLHEGANGEVVATVDIELYIKQNNEWSMGIFGTGGSKFIAKESSGMFTSDEAFKMAYTDAISVACKALGMGADIYYAKDRTKYTATEEEPETKASVKATPKQLEILKKVYTGDNLVGLLKANNISKIEDLSLEKASELIGKLKKKAEEKANG